MRMKAEGEYQGELMAHSASDDVETIGRISAVPTILNAVCRVTGMGFAAVARVTDTRWIACAVRDEIDFGLKPGGELDLATTICDEIRGHHGPVVIDHVAEDPVFRDHHTPAMYGFQSYISVPILRADGAFFGTLCAIDPHPRDLRSSAALDTFTLFAQLIATQLEAEERALEHEARLFDAETTAELRDQFIAVLGHDLRNPIAAVEGGMRLLERTPLDDKARTIIGMMRTSTARMSKLIDDVLDFARGRLGGGLPIDPMVHATLDAMLHGVVDEIRIAHPARQIEVDIALDKTVVCDPARIAQLCSNLLANAISHGDPAAPIRVSANHRDGHFRIDVVNQGDPIPEDKRSRLFQPFTRGEKGNPRDGLGLGLYIASEIAKAHGGRIDVDSGIAETRFILLIPSD
jgi:signal transduction histidine kinase